MVVLALVAAAGSHGLLEVAFTQLIGDFGPP
jgi:hypothetical protein